MNFALPTAVIILAFLPGVIFRNFYLSGKFSKRVLPSSPVTELAEYFAIAVPIDAAAFAYLRWRCVPMLSMESLIPILTGQLSEPSIKLLASELRDHWPTIMGAYVLLLLVSGFLGTVAQRIVWACRLDCVFSFLRMKHDWYYFLQGRHWHLPRKVMPYADIIVEHPEGSLLIRGMISGFEVNQSAEIRELVLKGAKRGKWRGLRFRWVDIPTDSYVLIGNTIRTINMHYLAKKAPSGWKGIWESIKGFFQSLFLGQP